MNAANEQDDQHRLDKWLWHARFFKTRSLAALAIGGGKVKVAGERVKPAHRVRIGERLSVSSGEQLIEIHVLKLPVRRGPAPEAKTCYVETAASIEHSTRMREQQRLASMTRPRPDSRPDKRERRQLDRLRRQQG